MTQRRAKRTYSEEQKKQLVELFNHGKPRGEIIREYDLTASAFDKWVKRINATGSSHDKDNRTPEELELLSCPFSSTLRANRSSSASPSAQVVRASPIGGSCNARIRSFLRKPIMGIVTSFSSSSHFRTV